MKKARAVTGVELWSEQVYMWHREWVRNEMFRESVTQKLHSS